MSSERAVAAALVDWVNSCPIDPKIQTLSDLSDGAGMAQVLLDIDPAYFKTVAASIDSGASPGAHWVLRFHKLKRLHKDLARYYTETLGHRLPSSPPNLTSIAKDGNVDETIKLVKIIVAAAVQSDRRESYIANIQNLSATSQTELMGVLNQMMSVDEEAEDPSEEEKGRQQSADDMDQFRMEEEMARLVAEKDAVEGKNKTLERRLTILQSDFEENQSHLSALQDQLSTGMADNSYANRTDPMIRSQLDQLQSDVQKLEDVIAEKEGVINTHENTISAYKRQVEDLRPKAEAGVKYKDDLDEAHHTIEKLRKTQNVAEKYRKKLEGMGELERQVKTLEEQNAQMLQDLRAGEGNAKQVPGLKRTIEQYKKQIEKLEGECAEALRAKHAADIEKTMLKERHAGAESQKNKDMERIQALEEKVRELESGVATQTVQEIGGDLDSELTYSTKTKTDMKMQISRLEDELALLKESGGAGADIVVLQHMLEDANKARDKLEQDFLQAHTDKLILEAQLTAIRQGTANEGSDVVLSLRKNFLDAETALSELKKEHAETIAELDKTKKELLTAQTDLSLVGKDKLEALDELKKEANQDLANLTVAHDQLEKAHKDLAFDLSQQKNLLNTVLLEKDELSKKLSATKDQILEKEQALSELKATIAAFEGSGEGRDAALEKRLAVLQNKLEERRERLTKSKEHIKKQNGIIAALKEQLAAAEAATADELLRAKEDQLAELKRRKLEELELFQRENALLATAWHDQASRLQMNSVVLLRRSDAPASWLNKQRSAVAMQKQVK